MMPSLFSAVKALMFQIRLFWIIAPHDLWGHISKRKHHFKRLDTLMVSIFSTATCTDCQQSLHTELSVSLLYTHPSLPDVRDTWDADAAIGSLDAAALWNSQCGRPLLQTNVYKNPPLEPLWAIMLYVLQILLYMSPSICYLCKSCL